MMTDLDTLRPEVREAVNVFDTLGTNRPWRVIRAELLRLAKENADLLSTIELDEQVWVQRDETMHRWIERSRNAEAELAALKARIAEAPIAQVRRILMWPESDVWTSKIEPSCALPKEWDNTRIHLVVEE